MALPEQQHVTYADYMSWDEDVRCEVIDGRLISYNFSPSKNHQMVLGQLHRRFGNYLENKPCEVMIAPFDVYLFADENSLTDDTDNWVEPDLFIICDDEKLKENGLFGAPDMVIEVLSPSNPKNDKIYKLNAYEKAGVQEYWIVDPQYQMVDVYLLEGDRLRLNRTYSSQEAVSVHIFHDLPVDLNQIFVK